MRTEKHIIKNRYSTHGIHRNIPVYEMNTVHCSASPMEGYKGTAVTLIDDAAWNEKFSAWALTGATATGNNIVLNNDVTAQGIYETAKNITYGTRTSGNKVSGFIGDQVTITGTPAWNEKTSSYSVTGATLTGNKFTITNAEVTAKANFETAKNVTLQTNGHGTIAANKTSGFIGDQVTLSNTPSTDYEFSAYAITGATLTGNKFNFIGNNVTAKAYFKVTGYIPSAAYKAWYWDSSSNSGSPVSSYKVKSSDYYYSPYTAASAATLTRPLYNTYVFWNDDNDRRCNPSVISLTIPPAAIDRTKNPTYSHMCLIAKVSYMNYGITLWENTEPHVPDDEAYLASAGRYDFLTYIARAGWTNKVYVSGFIDKQLFYTSSFDTENNTVNQHIEHVSYNFGQNSPITNDKTATANAFSYATYADAVNSILLR